MTDPKLFVIVCEYFADEVKSVIKDEEFDGVSMASFPSHCARPKVSWDSLKKIIPSPSEYSRVSILISCCAAEMGDPPQGLEHCHVHKFDQCFHMIVSPSLVDSWQKEGAYLLSPGWLALWRDRIKEWGFDRETAHEFLGESAAKLLLLDTGLNAKSPDCLAEFADFIDLPSERLPIGLDFLRMYLSNLLLETKLENEKARLTTAMADRDRRLADHGMAIDLLGNLIQTTTEKENIESITNLFSMLFAPDKQVYIPFIGGQPVKAQDSAADVVDVESLQMRLSNSKENYEWTQSGKGFILRIRHRDETLGIMVVDEMAFPEFKERYLNLALFIVDVCGIAINNSRAYQQIKLAEEKLKRYASELEKSNKEVKRFAYIVSHDLRAPLVNIKGFSGELRSALRVIDTAMNKTLSYLDDKQQSEVKTALQEDIPEAMGFIESSITSMSHFIDSVLEMSQVGHRELNLEPINMDELVSTTLKNLSYRIEESSTKVIIGQLPEVIVDRTSIEQIMGNILTNAVIYLDPERPGKIEISAENKDEETIFAVRDSGRGIDKSDMYKVFEPFRRAGSNDVKGEGMGMAYVKILVQRHEGRIWCESDLGVGTTFFFTIPHGLKKEKDSNQ